MNMHIGAVHVHTIYKRTIHVYIQCIHAHTWISVLNSDTLVTVCCSAAECCSVLQCFVVSPATHSQLRCIVLQSLAEQHSVLQCVAVCCSVLHCGSLLQCVAVPPATHWSHSDTRVTVLRPNLRNLRAGGSWSIYLSTWTQFEHPHPRSFSP
jgi:hypothetical protein